MIKEAKESLERIKGHFDPKEIVQKDLFNNDFSNIEQALNDLESIKEIFNDYDLGKYKVTSIREALLLLKQYPGSYGVRGQKLISNKLNVLEVIFENLKYGYVFVGFDRENKPRFAFATEKQNDLIKEWLEK